MHSIEVLHSHDGNIEVGLRGELDLSTIDELREVLSAAASFRRPVVVDLSGVTFMDLQSTRELAVRSQLYAHQLTLLDPSWQVRSSVRACKLGRWVKFERGAEQPLEKVS